MGMNTRRETFTCIAPTRSGKLFGKNRDRGNLLPIFFVLVLDLPPAGTGEPSQLFVFINFWSWRKKNKKKLKKVLTGIVMIAILES
jgi:hypothetical protein